MHFARTLEQMLAFLEARVPGPDGKPDGRSQGILRRQSRNAASGKLHRRAPHPGSFAATTIGGALFPATNLKDETRFIKFKTPAVSRHRTGQAQGQSEVGGFLHDDLENRIAAGDVRFSVMALLDRPGDPTMDVTIRWPDQDAREEVRLGTIVITGVEADRGVRDTDLQPVNLAEGIGYPPDEIFAAQHRLGHLAGKAPLIERDVRRCSDHVSFSGAPCTSRRHAPGLTPTRSENTRVKWL